MKAAERKCRVLWQQIVTLRDGRCLRCGHASPEGGEMQNVGHHPFGRNKNGSAFEPDAGLTLCPDCHDRWARRDPQDCHDLLREKIGEKRYTHLEFLSKQVVRLRPKDFSDIAAELKLKLLEMKGEI